MLNEVVVLSERNFGVEIVSLLCLSEIMTLFRTFGKDREGVFILFIADIYQKEKLDLEKLVGK